MLTIKIKLDKTYGSSYPYEHVFDGNKEVMTKFPFSPYMGNPINGFGYSINKFYDYDEEKTVFSAIIRKFGEDKTLFFEKFDSIDDAYNWVLLKTK